MTRGDCFNQINKQSPVIVGTKCRIANVCSLPVLSLSFNTTFIKGYSSGKLSKYFITGIYEKSMTRTIPVV